MVCTKYNVYRLKSNISQGLRDVTYEKYNRFGFDIKKDYYKLIECDDKLEIIDFHIHNFLERLFTLSEGSIHMGDVIELYYDNKMERYFCNNIGWIKL